MAKTISASKELFLTQATLFAQLEGNPDIPTDVTLLVGTGDNAREFSVHRYVLSLHSSVLRGMLYGGFKEGDEMQVKLSLEGLQSANEETMDSFEQLVKFCYTAQLELSDANVSNLLELSDFLQFGFVREECVTFLNERLSCDNVCAYLECSSRFHLDDLQSKCLTMLITDIAEVLEADGFGALSENNLVMLLNLEDLAVQEMELFEGVVRWGKWRVKRKQINDPGEFKDGGGEIKTEIENVLKYIRFPTMSPEELDSIAEKYEDIVPQAYLFEGLRYQIHKEKGRVREEAKFRSRKGNRSLLSGAHRSQIHKWCGHRLGKLLYRGSTDGFSVAKFHECCDEKGSTVVVVQSEAKHIFGGYTSMSWKSYGGYQIDTDAFLFSLEGNQPCPRRFPIHNIEASVIHDGNRGPVFGCGTDMQLLKKDGDHPGLKGTCYAKSYIAEDGEYNNTTLAGEQQFAITEVEVYQIQ